MNRQELERAIAEELGRRASGSTVDRVRCRVIVGRRRSLLHVLGFKLLETKPSLGCTPILGVIIPAVERVLTELNPESEGAFTLSLDATNRLSRRTPVKVAHAGAPAIAAALWRVFECTAKEYFGGREELNEIERALNSDLEMAVPDAADVVRRAEVGIVLARMVGRPDYESIAAAYVRKVNDFYKQDLEALIARCRGDILA